MQAQLGRVLPVVLHPSPLLRAVCLPVTDYAAHAQLFEDLRASAAAHGGLGLAAPQVGSHLRAFALLEPQSWTEEGINTVRSAPPRRFRPPFRSGGRRGAGSFVACINPRILRSSQATRVGMEACLSLPSAPALVRRAHSIAVAYEDEQGRAVERELSGLPAVVFQHEVDHLEGVLLIDKQEALPRGGEDDALQSASRDFRRQLALFYE